MTAASAFDERAAGYDRAFTETTTGRCMRAAVWRRLDARFAAGMRVLEVNCGTGTDAVYLGSRGVRVLATDASPGMVARTREKVRAAGLEQAVEVAELRIEDVGPELGTFDAILSNFGGLNCVGDLGAAAAGLGSVVAPGSSAVVCVMGPWVPWEWAWFLSHGDLRRAGRRLRRGGALWHGHTIRYPSPRALRRAFRPAFRAVRVSAVGALVPPPFAEPWAARHARVVGWLDALERRIETLPPVPALADHYLCEFERV